MRSSVSVETLAGPGSVSGHKLQSRDASRAIWGFELVTMQKPVCDQCPSHDRALHDEGKAMVRCSTMRWLNTCLVVSLFLPGCSQSSKGEAATGQASGIAPIVNTSKPHATKASEQESARSGHSNGNSPSPARTSTGTASAYGPIEGSILHDDAIDLDVRKTLASEDFDAFISAFEREHANDKDALELSGAYRSALSKSLAAFDGSSELVRFACGENVCMGYLRSEDGQAWFKDWYESLAAGKERVPFSAMLAENHALPGGGTEHRLLFSTQGKGGFFVKRP